MNESRPTDVQAVLSRWSNHMRCLAQPVVAGIDPVAELDIVLTRWRWIGAPLLAWRLQRAGLAGDNGDQRRRWRTCAQSAADDGALWWALVESSAGPASRWINPEASGSLFDQDMYRAVEVWIETELAALHALHHHARQGGSESLDMQARLERRIRSAAQWHLEHTQPDNATNRPWAAQVFLLLATPEAIHFAETLLSNCMVLAGRPDPLSAWILLDAAEAIEESMQPSTLIHPPG